MRRDSDMIDVPGGRVWFESAGEGPALLLLHGGPGAESSYLEPFMALAEQGYRVVRYDQLGSWMSDKPSDTSLFTVDHYREEVEIVRRTLGLGRMHLLGQSWGSFLALEYALHHQDKLRSLILYSGAASTRQCVDGMNRLRNALPAETLTLMRECEATGNLENQAYQSAIEELYRRHLCRIDPMPPLLAEGMRRIAPPVYETMWGPNEFTCTGTLMAWDRTSRLGEIRVPTLITCGRYDEVTPDCSETMHAGIPGAELVIFEQSSHLAHFEEPERYMATLAGFLSRNRG